MTKRKLELVKPYDEFPRWVRCEYRCSPSRKRDDRYTTWCNHFTPGDDQDDSIFEGDAVLEWLGKVYANTFRSLQKEENKNAKSQYTNDLFIKLVMQYNDVKCLGDSEDAAELLVKTLSDLQDTAL